MTLSQNWIDWNKEQEIYHGYLKNKDRDYAMKSMRDNGLTFQAIADCFGISKQRVHKIITQVIVNQKNGYSD